MAKDLEVPAESIVIKSSGTFDDPGRKGTGVLPGFGGERKLGYGKLATAMEAGRYEREVLKEGPSRKGLAAEHFPIQE